MTIRDQTNSVLAELAVDGTMEEYQFALEDMRDGLTDAIQNYTTPSVQGGRRNRVKKQSKRSK
jgi:hypothetical protein